MAFDKYFREELSFLKTEGQHYSELKPHLSAFLDGKHADPDVERLLEGFAFLTSRLREKLDDDFPELTHSMINMLWPNYLRPFPSTTIVEFTPLDNILARKKELEAGIKVAGYADESGVLCQFKTCRALEIYPIERTKVFAEQSLDQSIIRLQFKTHGEISLDSFITNSLTFFIGESGYVSEMLYFWMHHFLSRIDISIGDQVLNIPLESLQSEGFSEEEGILPYPKNVYQGYRVLHEYLVYPDAFLFFKLLNLEHYFKHCSESQFTLNFYFNKALPSDITISDKNFRLYCTPAINLFEHDAEPINLDGLRSEYRVISSSQTPLHYEIFSIQNVRGWGPADNKKTSGPSNERVYYPFESFQHEQARALHQKALYYRTRVRENTIDNALDHFISFSRSDELQHIGTNETISIELLCSNRFVPLELGKGDINICSDQEPSFVSVRNITEPSVPLHPAVDDSLLWSLISNLSLNYVSLLSKESLKTIIKAYDFRGLNDRQAQKITEKKIDEGVISIDTSPVDRVYRGLPVRGIHSTLVLNGDAFSSEGNLFLFAKVLSCFFALYASINSFHELTVINTNNNERYEFKAQLGSQPLI